MRDLIALVLLTAILFFTVFNWAGVTPREWNITLVAICVLSLFVWLLRPLAAIAPPLPTAISVMALVVFGYIALQLVPLPAAWFRVLSPNRFEILRALDPIGHRQWAPLSVSPQLTLAQLLKLAACFLVFCLTREFGFQFRSRPWVLAIPLLLIASIESAIGLAQHFATGGYATGTYANHGHLAGFLEMALPLALILIPITLRANRQALACILIACSALILAGLLYTASRMGLAASAVSMVVLGVLAAVSAGKRKAAVFTAVAALIVLVAAAPLSLVSRYETGLTAEVRLQIWRDTLKLIAHYPVFGSGFGTFVSAVQKYRAATPLALVDYAHNDYLQLLAELGAAGFLLLIGFGAVATRDMAGILRSERNQVARLIAIACAASLAAIATHILVDFQFYIPANMMAAAWIAGMIYGIRPAGQGRDTAQTSANMDLPGHIDPRSN